MNFQIALDYFIKVVKIIGAGFDFTLNYVLNLIDERQIIRRLILLMALAMTWGTWEWALDLAEPTTQQLGLLGAVNLLLGGIFKFYNDSREPKE